MKNIYRVFAVCAACPILMLSMAGCDKVQKTVSKANEKMQQSATQNNTSSTAKLDAWIDAQNRIVKWGKYSEQLDRYMKYNKDIEKSSALKDYTITVPDESDLIAMLSKAAAMPAALPEVDAAGNKLLGALKQVNPLFMEINSYQKSKGYLADGGAKARSFHKPYLENMQALITAVNGFDAALNVAVDARDRASLAAIKDKGSLNYHMLATSLEARKVLTQMENAPADPKSGPDLSGITASANAFIAANDSLGKALSAVPADKLPSDCKRYGDEMNRMVGAVRAAGAATSAKDKSNAMRDSVKAYNDTVDEMARCERDLRKTKS